MNGTYELPKITVKYLTARSNGHQHPISDLTLIFYWISRGLCRRCMRLMRKKGGNKTYRRVQEHKTNCKMMERIQRKQANIKWKYLKYNKNVTILQVFL